MHYHYVCNTIIGGHGFLEGVGQKICRPLVAAKIFSRWPFHQGVILLNRNEKKCSPQGSICPIFFSPWGYQGGGVYLFHLGCRPQKVFYPGVHPPTPPPRAHLWIQYMVQAHPFVFTSNNYFQYDERISNALNVLQYFIAKRDGISVKSS